MGRWVRVVEILPKIALVEPHLAYSAFNHGVKHQYTYIMRTIPDISVLLIPLDEAIDNFVRTLFYGYSISAPDWVVFGLPILLGGLGLIISSKFSDDQYASSVELTQKLKKDITDQQEILNIDDSITRAAKQKLWAEKLGEKADADRACWRVWLIV